MTDTFDQPVVDPGVAPTEVQTIAPPRPAWRDTWRRFRRQKIAMAAAIVIVVLALAGIFAPLIAPHGVGEMTSEFMATFSRKHLLGTDNTGFDSFSRLLFGIRTSLLASLVAVAFALVGGVLLGLVSGYLGGWVDTVLMRCTDAIMALPGLLMAMAVVGILGHGVFNAMIGLSVAFMPGFARLVRGQVLAVKEESFVEAAKVIGARPTRIIRKHIMPNIASPLIVQTFVSVGFALLAEGALAFVGLSVQPPDASLGSLLQQGFQFINNTPRLVLVPGVVIVLLSLSFNAVADGIRDALANKERLADVGAQA
ncbi:MAG: oligopeptide transporter permease protein [Ilumatobacteraceae bacterium]|nr:oligopeptide transporter permease protein [Ilumatobacteraceae bacterium]